MKKIFFIVFSICLIFENTSLNVIGGVYTAPLVMTIMPIIFILICHNYIRLGMDKQQRLISFFFIALLVYSLCYFFIFKEAKDIVFFLDRGIRFALLAFNIIILLMFLLQYNYTHIKYSYVIIGLTVVVVFLINLFVPDIVNETSLFQGTSAFSPNRMRGFTLEASTFGFQLCIAMLMLFNYFGVRLRFSLPIIMTMVATTTSKGALTALLISLILTIFINSRHLWLGFILTTVIAMFGYFTVGHVLVEVFLNDIENYSSVATRGTMIITSILTLLKNPLGVGFLGYLDAIYNNGPDAVSLLSSLYVNLFDFDEVSLYFIFGNVKSVSTKTFFFDWLIYFGVVFLYCYYKAFGFLIKLAKQEDRYHVIMLFFIAISTSTYLPLDGHFIALVPIGYLLSKNAKCKKIEKTGRVHEEVHI